MTNERQKPTTDAYRKNWIEIFGKKTKEKQDKETNEPTGSLENKEE